MKVILCDDSHYEIFLNHFYNQTVSFDNTESLEDYFRSIFLKLSQNYQIDVNGYYDITVYQDSFYGMVLDIFKEDLDYYDFSIREVDMKIHKKKETSFLFEIDDPFSLSEGLINKGEFYTYRHHFYYFLKQPITDIEMGKLLEQSILHYKETDQILSCAKKMEFSFD